MTSSKPFTVGQRVKYIRPGVQGFATVLDIERDAHGWDVEIQPETNIGGIREPFWTDSARLVQS